MLISLTSSGENRPNWISLIVRSGADEGMKLRFDMAVVAIYDVSRGRKKRG